ncbi:hypothetical protein N7462_008996 [Penicillium macrosclerotiorum]|uniref:uncharacterized protein n=1 Tax=Penicillium macrosclerotiorum TaxID=303699 RepID=UPI0025479284|nr:uncharacterized protein N7462_008996 [Penicillium macrosclerotiorum]KAJ5676099.1 hypothetical protein N7462_008996 [Penicillium macrosclerotiorum]
MSTLHDAASHTWVEGDFEHPNKGLRRSIIIALVFAFGLSTIAVALRLWARKLTGSKLFLDDYLILVALLFKYGCSIGVTILLWNGLGSHITMIPKKNLEVYFKIGWSNSIVYTGCICFIKLSILALYRRLFSTKQMLFGIYFMGVVVILWTVSIWVAGALNCIPVNRFWDPSVEGACIDMGRFYYGMQIPNIVSDLIILVMPLKVVWSLPIAKSQKILLSGVFIVGGLTLIFDIVRLVAMIHLTRVGPDITYNQVPVVVWTCIEAAVGIVAACLPNLRPLFKIEGRGFWSQLRSFSHGSSRKALNTSTASTSGNMSIQKGPIDSCVAEEGIEIHRYSAIIGDSKE